MTRFSGLMLLFSAISSLIYPVSWVRLLNSAVSATPVTTMLVLSAILGGLAFGGWLAHRSLRRGQNALKGFAFSQIVVAISAILLLPLLSSELITSLLPNQLTSQPIESAYGFMTFFLLLMIPTTAMGMSFPLFVTWFSEVKSQNSPVISHLYSLSALGGAAGILLAGFYLIPSFGLDGAIYFAAALNLLIAFFALSHCQKSESPEKTPSQTAVDSRQNAWHTPVLLVVLAITSFALMGSGIIWTKFLAIYTGTTLYGYSAIIFTVLAGLAIGMALMQYWQTKNHPHFKSLFWLLAALSIALGLSQSLLGYLPNLFSETLYLGELLRSRDTLLMALILLPSTLLFGAVFTQALTLYCSGSNGVRDHFGLAYAVKLLAAMMAALTTIFWLIPELGSSDSLLVFAGTPLIAALFIIPKLGTSKRNLGRYIAHSGLILSLGTALLFTPGIHLKEVLNKHHYRYINNLTPQKYFYLSEGATGLISLVEYGNELVHLQTNGLSQSFVHYRAPYKGKITDSLAGALPYLLQENPQNALVIGFGVGTTTRILASSELEGIVKVVESEPKVVEAMRIIGERHFDFLEDGRVELEYNDPRASLRADTERYSIIASQPSSPWLSGSNNLYSTEFFELVKSRLKDDGVFAHAFSLYRIDSALFKSILKTFYSVFPQGAVFSDLSTGEIVLLGGQQPMVLDYARSKAYFDIEEMVIMLRYGGLRNLPELPSYFLFSSVQAKSAAGDAEIITDSNLLIETRIPILSEILPKGSSDPYQLLKKFSKEQFTKIQ